MKQFKCAENPDHVAQVDVTFEDAYSVLAFLDLIEAPCSFTEQSLKEAFDKCMTGAERHDLAHQLLEDLTNAIKSGNEMANDPLFTKVFEALIETQEKCKNGEDHEAGQ